jgi:hypothetical protein
MENRVTESLLIASTMRSEHGRRTASEAKRQKCLRDLRVVLMIRLSSFVVRREVKLDVVRHQV